jgi:hypothetical protein
MEYKAIVSDDVTELILDDHGTFRRLFARLDDAQTGNDISEIWAQLAPLLEAHAVAEEETFYPALLKAAHDDDAVKDMIHDHNEIRDGVHAAGRCELGSDDWWKHVREARKANSDHMAEEERETLPVARKKMQTEDRVRLGLAFLRVRNAFPSGRLRDLDRDKDPAEYVKEHEGSA